MSDYSYWEKQEEKYASLRKKNLLKDPRYRPFEQSGLKEFMTKPQQIYFKQEVERARAEKAARDKLKQTKQS